MRIDPVSLSTKVAEARNDAQGMPASQSQPPRNTPQSAPPHEEQLSISFDKGQIIIYRFLDKETGDLIQQVPPEEVLRVVRSIQELLQNTGQQRLDLHV